MFKTKLTPAIRKDLTDAYHTDKPNDGPQMKRLKEAARQIPVETIWEELDSWVSAKCAAYAQDLKGRS